jgi:hypothetical protein
MAKLSKLTESSSALDAVNALKACSDKRLKLKGGKEGQAWSVEGTSYSGSIPMSSHNEKNLKVALKALIKAVEACSLPDA